MDDKTEKRKRTTSTHQEYKNYYQKQSEESPRICKVVNTIFKKSFIINGNEKYTLPKPELMFVENPWEIAELQKIKTDLNEIKSKLNNYCFAEWHQHTSQRNKAKDVEWRIRREFNPEFVTQAWCKFHEIVSKYPLVPKENIFINNNVFLSLHLCEAPGAFITCLNHWLKTNVPTIHWSWLAMTFNPYYEGNSNAKMISDDRFIMHTLNNWFFGKDNTGNLMTLENLDALVEKSKTKGKINLITADGSVNCISNPGEQEAIVASLHFCEVVAAILILEAGGNFLLKIFTTFEHQSICLIYFLSCIFKKISFYKPVTSKEGNSEVYMICLGFKGSEFVLPYLTTLRNEYGKTLTRAMFRKDDIPESFLQQLISCAQVFKNHQCEVIENNIAAYNSRSNASDYGSKKVAKLITDKFISDFPLQKLHIDLRIVGNMRLKNAKNNHWIVEPPAESFNERQKKQVLKPVCHLLMFVEQLKSLDPVVKTFVFKPINLYIDTCINVGKPYERALSSIFCATQISEIYNLIFQVVDTAEENLQLSLPTKDHIVEYECKMQQFWNKTYKIIHFHYTEICNNNQIIARIKQILVNLQNGENLVFLGFQLLTQFNVGLIYLLSHTFESVEFTINEQIGCSVTFKCFRHTESILQKIEQVYEIAEAAAANNTAILSVMCVTDLYGTDLYSIIVKLNNSILKYCVNCIASIYNKHKASRPVLK